MADSVDTCLKHWEEKWANNETDWHKTHVNQFIESHYDELTQGNHVKILFPLCGKAVDMKWMADKGHTVVGVEGVAKPCYDFFKEQNIEYTVHEKVPGWDGSLFQSVDGRMKIFCGDFLNFNSALDSGFSAVWDRGSYQAVSTADREKYVALMNQNGFLDPQCRYFLESFKYDPCLHPGPPDYISEDVIPEHFSNFSAYKIDQRDFNEGIFLKKRIPCVCELRMLERKSY